MPVKKDTAQAAKHLDTANTKLLTEALQASQSTAEFVRNARKLTAYIRKNRPASDLGIQVTLEANTMALERHGSMPRVPQTSASRRALGRIIADNNSVIHALRSDSPAP